MFCWASRFGAPTESTHTRRCQHWATFKTLVLLSLPHLLPSSSANNKRIFLPFLSTWDFPSFCLLPLNPPPPLLFSQSADLLFPSHSHALSAPQLPLRISSVKILWQMFLPHPTFQGLAGGSVSLSHSLSSVSLVTEKCNLCGCWGLWDWATMWIGREEVGDNSSSLITSARKINSPVGVNNFVLTIDNHYVPAYVTFSDDRL